MLALFFIVPGITMAQKQDTVTYRVQPSPHSTVSAGSNNPLSTYAFNRYIIDNFNFAILGTSIPTTGIKVETAKPSVTLSGNLHVSKTKTKIFNLELTAGSRENIAEIFSQNKTSGYLKASVGFNFLLGTNYANFTPLQPKLRTDGLSFEATKLMIMDSLARVNKYVRIAMIHKALADTLFFKDPSLSVFKDLYLKAYKITDDPNFFTRDSVMIKEVLARYGVKDELIQDGLASFVKRWRNAESNKSASLGYNQPAPDMINRFQAALFEKNYKEGEKVIELAEDSIANAEIKLYGKRYNNYTLFWGNVSPSISNTSFEYYDDGAVKTLETKNSFVPATKFAISMFRRYPSVSGKFYLVTFSLTPKRTSSLEDMSKLNYKKSTGSTKLADSLSSVNADESGIAYKGNYKVGFGIDANLEGYLSPWKHRFIPGFYIRIAYLYGRPWINQRQVPAEFGLLYNLNSSAKDAVNLLSLIPYVGWTNLKSSIKSNGDAVPLHDKFQFGLKLGIPINIGK